MKRTTIAHRSTSGPVPAIPNAVDEALRKVFPDLYTPELAQEISVDVLARLTKAGA